MGNCQWYIVGCYLIPNNTSTIESVVFVLKKQPHGSELLVAGDFNVKLSDLEWGWSGGWGGGYYGGANHRRFGEYVEPLTPAPAPMVPGREDVGHDSGG